MKGIVAAAAGVLLLSFANAPALAQDGKPCFEEHQRMRQSLGAPDKVRPLIACYTQWLNSGKLSRADTEIFHANRASLHALLGDYASAVRDMDQTIKLNNGT